MSFETQLDRPWVIASTEPSGLESIRYPNLFALEFEILQDMESNALQKYGLWSASRTRLHFLEKDQGFDLPKIKASSNYAGGQNPEITTWMAECTGAWIGTITVGFLVTLGDRWWYWDTWNWDTWTGQVEWESDIVSNDHGWRRYKVVISAIMLLWFESWSTV